MKQRKRFGGRKIKAAILVIMIAAGIFQAADRNKVQAGIGRAIILDKDAVTMYPGDKETLTLYIGNMKSQADGWSSTNKKVATVSKKGVITAKKAGKTTIKCRTGYGFDLTCKVKVKKRTEISGLLNKNYMKLVKKAKTATFSANDPLSAGNLYIFPDNSLFLRFNKNTNKADILQNTYNRKLSLYGVFIGQKAKKAKAALKSKKWKYVKSEPSGNGKVLTFKNNNHLMKVWTVSGRATGYQWIR